MRTPPGLHLQYVSLTEYQSVRWTDVLGIARFEGSEAVTTRTAGPAGIPIAHVSTPVLPAAGQVCEVWRCGESGESGQHDGVRFRRGGDVLFGCIAVTEAEQAGVPPGVKAHSPLQEATAQAYRQICATLDAETYPHLLRVWNYLPDINRTEHGGERYRQFNAARRHALRACGRALEGNVPAASVLGSPPASPLVVYFLAGRAPPSFLENPRQVSAYHYPREYGAYRPSFSRAALVRQRGAITLFISGTASIVGHRSLHIGDTAAQTREALANIEALLAEANRVARGARFELGALACKVYVRRPADLPLVQAELDHALGAGGRAIYLQADICREDLLVEIEAAAMYPCAA
jgi:chorismate lyase / 3-hydroxybenzoate synthase